MITVKLTGGLGNQMFQYALGRNLAIKHETELALDIRNYETGGGITWREFALDAFNINAKLSAENQKPYTPLIRIYGGFQLIYPYYRRKEVNEAGFGFDENILKVRKNCCLSGYWQSEKYFKAIESIIKSDFSFKSPLKEQNLSLAKLIETSNSVGIHVRRGDYVQNEEVKRVHGVCDFYYYLKAIDLIKERLSNINLFVFSDDLQWVKNHLKMAMPVYYVDNNGDAIEDMHLMSLCKHHIIANSTFSWWGAWLNKNSNKIVVAPKKWFATPQRNSRDIVPEKWLRI